LNGVARAVQLRDIDQANSLKKEKKTDALKHVAGELGKLRGTKKIKNKIDLVI
jgi:hypothetical protein